MPRYGLSGTSFCHLPPPMSFGSPRVRSRPKTLRGFYADRRGTAVAEAAICLPVLMVIFVGTIEVCNMLFIGQTLKVTAYEGSRVGIVPGANAANVNYQCESLLNDRNVQSASIDMTPADPSMLDPGDFFTVTIEADCGANSIIGSSFFAGRTMSRSVSLPRK